ncbi:MAG: ATP-binding cassette domain-containing protein [Thermodesulfobacteriota bacterium]
MLLLDDVSFSYDEEAVLQHCHLRVEPGSYESLIGPSGCGKSTIIRLLTGMLVPDIGTIHAPFKRIALVSQTDSLIGEISLLHNILYVGADRDTARRCLQIVGLGSLPPKRKAAELSVGMKKRLEIARALSVSPDFLVMDEPFNGLDQVSKYALIAQMKHFLCNLETTLLYVTHDIGEALVLCDNITVLSHTPTAVSVRYRNVQQADRQQMKQKILQKLDCRHVFSSAIEDNG